eukprot:scaffold34801_cov24-Cyclotella_meneghiniana.AAC.1
MQGTEHSKSDDGEANMMNEDKNIKIVEPVVDVPKSSKRRPVSEKYAKWKHGTLKNAYNLEGKKIVKTDNNALTNQPEIAAIPPPLSSRVMGCRGAGAEAEFVENPWCSAVMVMAEQNRRKQRQR